MRKKLCLSLAALAFLAAALCCAYTGLNAFALRSALPNAIAVTPTQPTEAFAIKNEAIKKQGNVYLVEAGGKKMFDTQAVALVAKELGGYVEASTVNYQAVRELAAAIWLLGGIFCGLAPLCLAFYFACKMAGRAYFATELAQRLKSALLFVLCFAAALFTFWLLLQPFTLPSALLPMESIFDFAHYAAVYRSLVEGGIADYAQKIAHYLPRVLAGVCAMVCLCWVSVFTLFFTLLRRNKG